MKNLSAFLITILGLALFTARLHADGGDIVEPDGSYSSSTSTYSYCEPLPQLIKIFILPAGKNARKKAEDAINKWLTPLAGERKKINLYHDIVRQSDSSTLIIYHYSLLDNKPAEKVPAEKAKPQSQGTAHQVTAYIAL